VLGISTITNVCSPDKLGTTTGEDVISVAQTAANKVGHLIEGILATDDGQRMSDVDA
jgi:hypothetical protein